MAWMTLLPSNERLRLQAIGFEVSRVPRTEFLLLVDIKLDRQ